MKTDIRTFGAHLLALGPHLMTQSIHFGRDDLSQKLKEASKHLFQPNPLLLNYQSLQSLSDNGAESLTLQILSRVTPANDQTEALVTK